MNFVGVLPTARQGKLRREVLAAGNRPLRAYLSAYRDLKNAKDDVGNAAAFALTLRGTLQSATTNYRQIDRERPHRSTKGFAVFPTVSIHTVLV